MPVTINYTEAEAIAALRDLILTITPGIEVIRAQANRVPEPKGVDFVLMTVILRTRLAMNVDVTQDVIFDGSITGTTLTYDPPTLGDIRPGTLIFGAAVGTSVVSVDSASTATLSTAQSVPFGPLYAGYKTALQATELQIQLDVHGPASGDNAQKLSTLLRDEYATSHFDATGLDLMALYTSDPRQVPFINAEAQWDERWTFDAVLQANQIIQVPQEFADELHMSQPAPSGSGLIDVDATYPP